MNFQRGIAPTEAMGVGQIALAPVISHLYQLDPNNMRLDGNGKAFPAKHLIIDNHKTLEEVRDGQSSVSLRFLAFSTATEFDKFGQEVIHRLSEYKGLYVKLGETAYKIPK